MANSSDADSRMLTRGFLCGTVFMRIHSDRDRITTECSRTTLGTMVGKPIMHELSFVAEGACLNRHFSSLCQLLVDGALRRRVRNCEGRDPSVINMYSCSIF